jgi:hypothetical protein
MIQTTYEHDKIMQGLAELRKINKEPLCPSVFKEHGSSWQRKDHDKLPFKGGIYAYWFKGTEDELNKFRKYAMENPLILQGKQKANEYHQIQVNFTEEWLDAATVDGAICLYVGKSTNIPSRITGHIMPTTRGRLTDEKEKSIDYLFGDEPKEPKRKSTKKPNSSSQLRIGLERILPHYEDVRPVIMQYVHLSYCDLDGYEESVNRFFLEDLAIGTFHPLLNVDIER